MKIANILKKDIVIILGMVVFILLFTIGVVYAATMDFQKKNVVVLEKKVISKEKESELITVQMEESEHTVQVMQVENKNEKENDYYIKVNYQANTVTVYTKDETGEYTIPEKVFICSFVQLSIGLCV